MGTVDKRARAGEMASTTKRSSVVLVRAHSRFFAGLVVFCLSFVDVTEFVTILVARGDGGLARTCGHPARCCAGLGGAKQVC